MRPIIYDSCGKQLSEKDVYEISLQKSDISYYCTETDKNKKMPHIKLEYCYNCAREIEKYLSAIKEEMIKNKKC